MQSCMFRVVVSNYLQILCCENRKYLETVLGSDQPLARLVSAEYREVQKARLIDVVPVLEG